MAIARNEQHDGSSAAPLYSEHGIIEGEASAKTRSDVRYGQKPTCSNDSFWRAKRSFVSQQPEGDRLKSYLGFEPSQGFDQAAASGRP